MNRILELVRNAGVVILGTINFFVSGYWDEYRVVLVSSQEINTFLMQSIRSV